MTIHAEISGIPLIFETAPTLFSPTRVDSGTDFLLSCVDFQPEDKVLDLGCGYGVVGIFVAKVLGPQAVYMIDSDPEAVRCAQRNASITYQALSTYAPRLSAASPLRSRAQMSESEQGSDPTHEWHPLIANLITT